MTTAGSAKILSGLVAVLHGPPGTGKTLTAESIAELVKAPLYVISSGGKVSPTSPDGVGTVADQ
jgi:MoxR-like ATPase